jgi:hypothetical protein
MKTHREDRGGPSAAGSGPRSRPSRLFPLALISALIGPVLAGSAIWTPAYALQDIVPLKELAVPADAGWVDTGIDVGEDEELFFLCDGEISLQRGNPEAACGPDGTDIQGLQQPVPDHNLGAFVGKVGLVVAFRTDEKTGEEVPEELAKTFFIGRARSVAMPMRGRLYLGVNENVVKDNSGEFRVLIFRKAPGGA